MGAVENYALATALSIYMLYLRERALRSSRPVMSS